MEITTNSKGQIKIWTSNGDLIHKPLLWQERGLMYTASGYGAKIPTSNTIRFQGRERRIYCTIYGNAGTAWIMVKGERITIEG